MDGKSSKSNLMIALAVIALLIVGVVVMFTKSNTPKTNSNSTALPNQTAPAEATIDASSTEKSFDISAGMYYFMPNKITVNVGDAVTLKVKNTQGNHDIVIDELDVKSSVLGPNEETTVTFTATTKGSYVYYCSVPGHREKGMWGTLEVK